MNPWSPLSPPSPARELLSRSVHAAAGGEPVIDIPGWKLALIAALLAAPLTVAGIARLHVNRPLIVAGVRCLLQLLLLGNVLRFLFNNANILWIGLYIVFMMTVASLEAGSRPSMSYKVSPSPTHGHSHCNPVWSAAHSVTPSTFPPRSSACCVAVLPSRPSRA